MMEDAVRNICSDSRQPMPRVAALERGVLEKVGAGGGGVITDSYRNEE